MSDRTTAILNTVSKNVGLCHSSTRIRCRTTYSYTRQQRAPLHYFKKKKLEWRRLEFQCAKARQCAQMPLTAEYRPTRQCAHRSGDWIAL
jgi:hypothetical protein